MDVTYYHENSLQSIQGDDDSKFTLFFFESGNLIEEKLETLVYDLVGLLAAVGGNLGLLLGFSCLSVLISIISKFQMDTN